MKWDILRQTLFALSVEGRFALAYSGGLDSRFLAHAARSFGLHPLLLHVTGPHIPEQETAYARSWARGQSLEFHEFALNPLEHPKVAAGDIKRCYYCKFTLFSRLKQESANLPLCDGTHASDSQGYRPGLLALRELEVLSPLAEAGLDKPDIRALGAATGMDNPNQLPRPCMLTRLDYGLAPSPELLRRLDQGERTVEAFFQKQSAMPDFRLRLVAPSVIELHVEEAQSFVLSQKDQDALFLDLERQHGISLRSIRLMPSLSGYFDRKKN